MPDRRRLAGAAALLVLALAGPAQAQASSPPAQITAQAADAARAAQAARLNAIPDTPGAGPYPARMSQDPGLPNHVIYRPADLSALGQRKLGVLIWGNGGCVDDGASARLHLSQIASYGYVVIAPGRILSGPSAAPGSPAPTYMAVTDADMLAGLDWILSENQRQGGPFHNRIDPKAVALSGHSCGGILSIKAASDPRVATVVIHNSGVFPNRPERPTLVTDKAWLKRLRTPILYIVGNATDVGHPVALDDFSRIDHVPVMLASIDRGHGGTFFEPNGGPAAQVAVQWLEWRLRGNAEAGRLFSGAQCGLCVDPAWTVQRKNMP